MKKILFILAFATALVACNNKNNPDSPEDQQKAAFIKAHYFEAIGINSVPSEQYTQDSVIVKAYLSNENIVTIELYGVGFSSRMPLTIDMSIPNVKGARTAERITLSGDSIIPMMGERPFDRYIITDLNGYITPDSLVFVNNYGTYEDCKYAGKITKMLESNTALDNNK